MKTISAQDGNLTTLENRHTSHLDVSKDIKLCVKDGTAYVTVEGDARDYIVRSGETLKVDARGLVVIQGFPTVSYKVCA
jgi:hypothetical protein